jgi:L,D-peptidoglycan transpeptidase YkuD (ErfK/YbiS/YcfS/YnhG family)
MVSPGSMVAAVYQDFLARVPSTTERDFQVAAWSGRAALVTGIARSPEWISTRVAVMYTDTLGRAPDPSGLATWTSWIAGGSVTITQAAAYFYSSQEYFAGLGGNTVTTWVTALYRSLLHRDPDQAGLAFWTARALGAPGRASVAYDIYQSRESRASRVRALYRLLLHRDPDPAGSDFWTGVLQTSGDIELAISLAASAEYAQDASTRYPDPTWAGQPHRAPGTDVEATASQQVAVARWVSGTSGTWARFQWDGSTWLAVAGRAGAVFGANGVVPAAYRIQGTDTTPTGTFALLSAFGQGSPGTLLPYQRITSCSWWVEDPTAPDYKRWRESCTNPPAPGTSEHLADYLGRFYQQAVVTDFNYDNPIRYGYGSGAGIFVHYDTAATGGCVGVDDLAEMTRTVQWLDPAQHPVISIG